MRAQPCKHKTGLCPEGMRRDNCKTDHPVLSRVLEADGGGCRTIAECKTRSTVTERI